MGGWMNRQIKYRQTDKSLDRQTNGCTDRQIDKLNMTDGYSIVSYSVAMVTGCSAAHTE